MNKIEFYKETNFKQTEIGEIPIDWKIASLSDKEVAEIIMGQSPPSTTYNKNGRGLPFLQGKMEFGEIYPSPTIYCSNPLKVAEQNDVLISVRAPVGDVNIAPYKLCIGRGLAAIRFNPEKANFQFYFYYLKKIKSVLENLGKGSTFKAINRDDLERLRIPLPPVEEQKAIAEILSTVDEAIQKTNEVIAKTERLKKGLMQELLTKGIGHKEFKDTEIGKIPKTWQIVKLGEIGDFQYGITASAIKENTGIKLLRITDITNEGIDWEKVPYCKISEAEFDKYKLNLGDVLFARIGATTGKSCYINQPVKAVFGSYLIKFIPIVKEVDTYFLYIYTQSETYWSQVNKRKEGQLKKGLNTKMLSSLLIPLPPLEEQHKISKIFSVVNIKLELERKEKARLELIKRGLMDLLLTGKIRVRVG